MYGLDGCEPMGLDDELAIAFIYNTVKQDMTNEHPHVILHVNINTMPMLHVVTMLLSSTTTTTSTDAVTDTNQHHHR